MLKNEVIAMFNLTEAWAQYIVPLRRGRGNALFMFLLNWIPDLLKITRPPELLLMQVGQASVLEDDNGKGEGDS